MPNEAIVIGAGIAGIASAIRLAVKGYQVQVFEANGYAGGKLSEQTLDGFRFDAGPSLFTMPHYVDQLFELAERNPRDHFNYRRLGLVCRYHYEDGTVINAWADQEQFAAELEAKTTDSAAAVKKFLAKSASIYDITSHVFLERSLHRWSTYLDWKTWRSVIRLPGIDSFRTMNQANEQLFSDSKTIRLFNRYATYNGSDPYQAPATLNVIPHIEHHFGAWFPEGGMISITRSLVKLAEELGIAFHYNTPVDEILVETEGHEKKVRGIRYQGRETEAEVVLSNMDVFHTYSRLLKNAALPARRTGKRTGQERSSSALIFYWGIGKQFPQLDLHNIFFSEDYPAEFKALWQDGTIFPDPTVYVNISSKYHPGDAPAGCENWFVMINVPSDSGQDWDSLRSAARQYILDKLSRNLGEDIAPLIRCEASLDPRGIALNTASYQGSIYGTSSNNRYAAFLRHANRAAHIRGLYFAGGSVHPGGGIPLALLSAKIATGML